MRKLVWGIVGAVVGLVAALTLAVPQAGAVELLARPATVTYDPVDGATDVEPRAVASASVANGAFEKVELTGSDGTTVRGGFDGGRTRWTSTAPLHYATTYTWRGIARGDDDRAVELGGSFSTFAPESTMGASFNVDDDQVVGVATPVMVRFDGHVADRASAERALSLTTSVPVEGAWGWLPDEEGRSRVHWRPREYWPAGTEVAVSASLLGVSLGDGVHGARDVTVRFRIGPAQVVKADVRSHRMKVFRDGAQVADYPASYGVDADPERTTRSGIHVVSETFDQRRMISERFDYDVVMKWAVRISNNGEFIHANPNTTAEQGRANVSHGCVNLSEGDAKAYYDMVQYGDPVEVTGSGVQLSARDGDIWDWTLSWQQWRALSAL
ncbi:L,D-transpeptidase [Pseudonocardia sp.]|uniref:L,D-transpeptidase n=1 Tax=Pseudonocardia sp. TaxID=60912 RepID=UPI003D113FD5